MAMGEAALAACGDIDSIHFELPNMHRIPFNLEPFGLKFENDMRSNSTSELNICSRRM